MKNFRITGIPTFTYPTRINTVILPYRRDIPRCSIADDPFTFDHHL